MPPTTVLGRITGTAGSPKLTPAPTHRNVLGISTKLAAKNTSASVIDELTPRSPPSGNHCINASYIVISARSPPALQRPGGCCLHLRPYADPAECFPQRLDLRGNSNTYRQPEARQSASGLAEACRESLAHKSAGRGAIGPPWRRRDQRHQSSD